MDESLHNDRYDAIAHALARISQIWMDGDEDAVVRICLGPPQCEKPSDDVCSDCYIVTSSNRKSAAEIEAEIALKTRRN